jgi:hypothetical protein
MLVSHFGHSLFLRGNPAARTKHLESSHYRPGRIFLLRDNKVYAKFETAAEDIFVSRVTPFVKSKLS